MKKYFSVFFVSTLLVKAISTVTGLCLRFVRFVVRIPVRLALVPITVAVLRVVFIVRPLGLRFEFVIRLA